MQIDVYNTNLGESGLDDVFDDTLGEIYARLDAGKELPTLNDAFKALNGNYDRYAELRASAVKSHGQALPHTILKVLAKHAVTGPAMSRVVTEMQDPNYQAHVLLAAKFSSQRTRPESIYKEANKTIAISLGRNIINTAADIEPLQRTLLRSHYAGETAGATISANKIAVLMDGQFVKELVSDANGLKIARAAAFVGPLVTAGMLSNRGNTSSIFTDPIVASSPPFAHILRAGLDWHGGEFVASASRVRHEYAGAYLLNLLQRYDVDSLRHTDNTHKILNFLFDTKIPHAGILPRRAIITLRNQYLPADTQVEDTSEVIETALGDVLGFTIDSQKVTKQQGRAMLDEDALHAGNIRRIIEPPKQTPKIA